MGDGDMNAAAGIDFVSTLAERTQSDWDQAVEEVLPSAHPVDREATRIWFRFWPLRLCREFEKSSDPEQTAKDLELDGRFQLKDQIDTSVTFFYGSRYWPQAKEAVLAIAADPGPDGASLSQLMRRAADRAASAASVDASLLIGVSAAAWMTLRQCGLDVLASAADAAAPSPFGNRSPEQVLKARQRTSGGVFDFLKGASRVFRVTWNEGEKEGFPARNGQDLSWAAAGDKRDYTSLDPRRLEGPIPAQCRSAACGYCWVGILQGKENLSQVTEFERRRLDYFGYRTRGAEPQSQPSIRLACQAKCQGDVTVVVPPWNGVLDGKR